MPKKLIKFIFIVAIIVFAFAELRNLTQGKLSDRAIAVGYFAAIGYVLVFGFFLRSLIGALVSKIKNKRAVFALLGFVGAFFVETVIWLAQIQLKTTGAAISNNLLVDLIITLPFYTLLAYFFAKLAEKYYLSFWVVIFAGGLYEYVADGVIGNLFKGSLAGVLIAPVLLPVFVIVYAPIILVPYLILRPYFLPTEKLKGLKLLSPAKATLILFLTIPLGLILEKILGF